MTTATSHQLILPASEYHYIARCINHEGLPVEIGFTISYRAEHAPVFCVENWKNNDGTETDALYTEDAQEALKLYNSIVQRGGS